MSGILVLVPLPCCIVSSHWTKLRTPPSPVLSRTSFQIPSDVSNNIDNSRRKTPISKRWIDAETRMEYSVGGLPSLPLTLQHLGAYLAAVRVVSGRSRRAFSGGNTTARAMYHAGHVTAVVTMLSIDGTGADAGYDQLSGAPSLFAQLCPRASEAACAHLAYSLALEGRVVLKGMSRGREVERGKGWVVLDPGFFVHDIVGGVFRSTGRGAWANGKGAAGIVSAAVVCEAVIG